MYGFEDREGKWDEVGEKGRISMRNTVWYPLFVKYYVYMWYIHIKNIYTLKNAHLKIFVVVV